MIVKRAAERDWIAGGYEGAERALLRVSREDGRTSIVRLKAGARGPRHTHSAGEDILVLSGKVRLAGEILEAGDYMYTEPGEDHYLEALEDSVIFASTAKPVTMLEK
jgi:quercetin dioxygenase-like cupin family protein